MKAALSAGQLRHSLLTAFQQKQWQWAHLLRMAMTFMPATLGRSDDLRKLPWSCLALRTQDNVGPVPSVAILFGSMQGKTVKPEQVDIPGVVRYAHSCCQTQLGSVLQCFLSHYASSATGTETIASVLRQRLPTWLSPPSSQLQVWKLSNFQTVPKAFEAFSKISGTMPSNFRRWHGSKKEARASSMAFSRFRNGLVAEVRNRMAALGSTMAAFVGALKMERERIPPTRTVSSLQQLCSKYGSDSKLLGKRKQSD